MRPRRAAPPSCRYARACWGMPRTRPGAPAAGERVESSRGGPDSASGGHWGSRAVGSSRGGCAQTEPTGPDQPAPDPPRPQTRPALPSQQGQVDSRSWAQRAHALEQSSLPPAPPRPLPSDTGAVREYNDENYRPGGVRPQELSSEFNRASSEEEEEHQERSPATQPEQTRPPVNTFSRPTESESQNRVEEERRVAPSVPIYQRPAEAPQAPATRFAPPSAPTFQRPAEAPRLPENHVTPPQPPRPQAAPARQTPSLPQQHVPAREERGGGRPPSRTDQNPR